MGRKTIFKPLNVYEDDFNKIHTLAKAMGISKAILIQKIVEGIFDAASEFLTQDVCGMLVDVSGRTAQFNFYGRSNLIFDHFSGPTEESDESVDAKVKERTERQLNEKRAEEDQPEEKLKEDKWSEKRAEENAED